MIEQTLFTLQIISPTKAETHKVHWVEIESPSGSFVVGINHSKLISVIKKKSTLRYENEAHQECALEVTRGIFKVAHNKAVALLEL